MLAFNIYHFSRNTDVVSNSCTSGQQGDNATSTQLDCTHDCSACGKCFPADSAKPVAVSYNLTIVEAYKLTAE